MPGFLHDGVVTLLEQHPELLLDAWVSAGGLVDLRGLDVEVVPNELRITFGGDEVRHLRPDLVMKLTRRGRVVGAGSGEVQSVRDLKRPRAWALHRPLISQRFDIDDPLQFLVPLGRSIERWAEREIAKRAETRHMCLLGPSKLARLETLDEVKQRPYHAAFAVAVHRHDATPQMCEAVLRVLFTLSDAYAMDYVRMVLTAVPRPLMEDLLMGIEARELKIDAADKQGYLYSKAFEDGERAGRREGRKRGRELGRKEGRQEGLQAGQLMTIETLLSARSLAASPKLLERLRECTSDQLLRATVLAGTASSIDEIEALLFGKPPPARRKPAHATRRR
ncbi:hypothetical protein ACNOYE_20085 [Nannocystaceae bacterium ST9]